MGLADDIEQMQRHIKPLNINGLTGRVLKIDATKKTSKREILIVYGHHSSLERMYGVAEAFADYGTVTMPDLPGFGGMDSFYTIDMKPSVDNLADYLATFVKLRYRSKKVVIIGVSFGFVIATRMLQKYPELADRIDIFISLVGFAHRNDFAFSRPITMVYRALSYTFSKKIPARIFYHTALQPVVIRTVYSKMPNARAKFADMSADEKRRMLDFEAILWRANDVQTHAYTNHRMFLLDNCRAQIPLPVHHIYVSSDQYFDRAVVEQHMRIIFDDYTEHEVMSDVHAPSVVANKHDAERYIPATLQKLLKKKPVARKK